MTHKQLFRLFIVTNWMLQLLMYILPISSWYPDPVYEKLLALNGYGSILSLNIPFLYIFPLWGYLFATVGMFFLQKWGIYLYLGLLIYGACSVLLFGIQIILPAHGFIGLLTVTIDGVILALIFLTPLHLSFTSSSAAHSREVTKVISM